jgi:uncharacterized repeat protein (TIGR01451 family)
MRDGAEAGWRGQVLALVPAVLIASSGGLASAGTPVCTPPPSGMLSWWSGDGHPFDPIGHHDGTLTSGATYASGLVAQAFSFDGLGARVDASGTVGDFGSGAFTVDFWMRSDNAGGGTGGTYVVGKSHADGGQGWDIRLDASRIRVVGVNGWGFNIASDASITIGDWHHVALSSTVTDVALYVDGVLKGSSPRSAISTTTNPFRIGYATNYGGGAFGGLIDEVEVFDRALTQPEIQAIYDAGGAGKCKPCVAPAAGLVSWWPGDGHSLDLTGGNNGVLVNGAAYSAGWVGPAFALDGVDDHVRVPDSTSLDLGNAITLEAWVYPLDPSHAGILAKGVPGTDGVYELALYQGKFYFRLNGALLNMPSVSSVPASAWTHVAGTFDGSTAKIYINGVLDASQPYAGPIATDANPLHIGLYGQGPVYFSGQVDEVKVHDRALSAEEIAAEVAAGSWGTCRSTFVSRTLTVSRSGAGSGTVTGPGIDCGLDCAEVYAGGSAVSLTATPGSGFEFTGWSGDCTGTANPFDLTMDADKTCGATFDPRSVAIGTRTKTVAGAFVIGGSVTYTVTISNSGNSPQPDNPGHEFEDVLPASLALVSAGATSGTAAADLGTNTVTWNGVLASGGSVTITIEATVAPTTALGTTVSNQGTIRYDGDASGDNETSVLTDDPGVPGANDPTTFAVVSPDQDFFSLTPCRLLDTRDPVDTYGGPALAAGADRVFPLFGRCFIPATARAVSVNLTVAQPTAQGNLRLYPARTLLPAVSSINYVAGQTRANNAIVPLNGLGELAVHCSQAAGTVHVILDVNGYFQ